jgi:hypothetical protein
MCAQRLAHGMAHQAGAVRDVAGLAFELRIGEQNEPGSEGGAIGLIRQPDLREDGYSGQQAGYGHGGDVTKHHDGEKVIIGMKGFLC